MKILVDENLDRRFPDFMPKHEVFHVIQMGWQGMKNGELLGKAQEQAFELFITADKNLPYQQSMKGRSFSLIVLNIHPNMPANQVACIVQIEKQRGAIEPSQVYVLEGPQTRLS